MSGTRSVQLPGLEVSYLGNPAVTLALASGACSTLSTSVDWDPVADFSRYKTWEWRDTGDIRDPVWDQRVEDVLEDTLATKGVTKVQNGADLWGVVHARLSVEMQVDAWNAGWGYGWGWGPGPAAYDVSQVSVGTIIVDLVDAKLKVRVWRGRATDALRPDRYPEEREKALRKVLAQLFANYPPGTK
jgi:hypothetical protein